MMRDEDRWELDHLLKRQAQRDEGSRQETRLRDHLVGRLEEYYVIEQLSPREVQRIYGTDIGTDIDLACRYPDSDRHFLFIEVKKRWDPRDYRRQLEKISFMAGSEGIPFFVVIPDIARGWGPSTECHILGPNAQVVDVRWPDVGSECWSSPELIAEPELLSRIGTASVSGKR